MKIQVKLYGTLRDKFPDYQHSQGIEIELPEGAKVKDLLNILNISESQGAVATTNSQILKYEEIIHENNQIQIFQTVHSG